VKLLITRFSSIGDIVLCTPVFRCIKEQLPEAEIHFVTKKAYAGLLAKNPYIDRIWVLGDSFSELATSLKAERFDRFIDLHNNLRTKRLSRALGLKRHAFNKINLAKWLIVNLKINRLPDVHIVDRYLATVHHLGVKNDGKGLDFHIPDETELPDALLGIGPFVCYAIGGQHNTKKMPLDRIVELTKTIHQPVVLIGGPEDERDGDEIAQQSSNVINLCGKVSINQSALVMKHSTYVISHDTGMMHIAAALQKKIVSIWGNTIPEFGMSPYQSNKDSMIAEVRNLSCRPCSKIGHDKCPKGHFKCMNNIDLRSIANKINA
jgi:ADP-heptose:LPS heptosyltransferase